MTDLNLPLTVTPLQSEKDDAALRAIAAQTFDFPEDNWDGFVEVVGKENLRVARVDQKIVGGLSFYPVKQWFGGKAIPTAAIALVCIAPELRGQGHATKMLNSFIQQQVANGFPLATLYPSTVKFYRKLNFEHAGNSYTYSCSLDDIKGCKLVLPMQPIETSPTNALLHSIANKRAEIENGHFDRNEGMWQRICREQSSKVYSYVVGEPGKEVGYLIYDQTRSPGRSAASEKSSPQRTLNVRDMVALNAQAMETIWAFIKGHGTVREMVRWNGPASDARMIVLSEYEPRVPNPSRWMLRLCDARQALALRGYPKLDVDLPLSLADELNQENTGQFTLSVRSGNAEIIPEVRADPIHLEVRDLASLYSGFYRAERLQQYGKLTCGNPETVAQANALFHGAEPWMPDRF